MVGGWVGGWGSVQSCPVLRPRVDGLGSRPSRGQSQDVTQAPSSMCSRMRLAIVTWIERTYHRRRRQVSLGRLTPIEYETIMTARATQAA